jgi:hypothetical protein
MSELTLRVHCPECGRPLSLVYETEDRPEATPGNVHPCDYPECRKLNSWFQVPGEVVDSWIGHGPDPEAPPEAQVHRDTCSGCF